MCPCTKIEILLKSHRDHMLVSVLVSVVPVPKVRWYSTALGYRYHYIWYRYHCFTACGYRYHCFIACGTGTSKCGTGTTASTIARLHCSTTRGLSTAVVIDNDDLHLFSRTKPLRKCARDSKNLHTHKNATNGQKHLFYTKSEQNMS